MGWRNEYIPWNEWDEKLCWFCWRGEYWVEVLAIGGVTGSGIVLCSYLSPAQPRTRWLLTNTCELVTEEVVDFNFSYQVQIPAWTARVPWALKPWSCTLPFPLLSQPSSPSSATFLQICLPTLLDESTRLHLLLLLLNWERLLKQILLKLGANLKLRLNMIETPRIWDTAVAPQTRNARTKA